jgi:hypothetical protein
MKYYVYFDAYGHPRQTINEEDLTLKYDNDIDKFLRSISGSDTDGETSTATGHVGTFRFDSEEELADYLHSLGDELTGFYDCEADSRPYNF